VWAEQVNASQGIGYLMNNAQQFFQTDVIVVCLVTYAVLGLLCDCSCGWPPSTGWPGARTSKGPEPR